MLNNEFSGEYLNSLLLDFDSHTKKEYYEALLNITEYYLNELLSTVSLQEAITQIIGDERAEELIEKISLTENEKMAAMNLGLFGEDKLARIRNLYTYLTNEYRHQMNTADDLNDLNDFGNFGDMSDIGDY